MKRLKIVVLSGLVLLILMSCTTAKFSGLQMSNDLGDYSIVGEFSETIWVNEFLGVSGGSNWFNVTSDAMDGPVYDEIRRQIQRMGGDAAILITIEQHVGLFESLLNSITGTIYAPCSVTVSGTVVKY